MRLTNPKTRRKPSPTCNETGSSNFAKNAAYSTPSVSQGPLSCHRKENADGLLMRESKMRSFAAIFFFLAIVGLRGAQSPAPKNPETAKLNQQIGELCKAAKYSEAMPLATKLLQWCEKTF